MTLDFFLLQKLNGLAFVWPQLDSLIVFLAKRLPYLLAGSVFILPFFTDVIARSEPAKGGGATKQSRGACTVRGIASAFGLAMTKRKTFYSVDFRKRWQVVLESFLAAGVGLGIARLIRFFWLRPRPLFTSGVNSLIGHQVRSGFPSVHSTFFFALSTVLVFYNKKAGIAFFSLSALIVLSRVSAGLHWPSDILAGLALGILSGLLVKYLFKRLLTSLPSCTAFRRA